MAITLRRTKSCPIVPAVPASSDPIDLTYAALRSVSPIHIQYLKNMRVGASMSISIIVGGELWGLIACHHGTAKAVSSKVRAAAELLGQVFSLQIQTVEGIEAYVTMRAARALLDRVVSEFPVEGDLVENLSSRLEQIGSFIRSDGIGLWMDGVWQAYGVAPHIGQIPELAHFVDRQRSEQIFSTQNLAGSYSRAADWGAGICGMLAVPLSHGSGDYLFFFRGEVVQSIDWGGDPAKAVAAPGNGVELSPRQSFAVWKQDVRNQSLPWSSREKLIAETLRVYLLDIIVRFSEVILEERRQAELRIRLQASELNHRVKGTLELIQSLVSRGSENAGSVYEFVRGLHGRLQAIALAHDAISLSNGSEVRVLLETAFSAQLPSAHRLSLDGPETRLDAKAYTVLALVVHELVSNAVRHGALSTRDGHLSVRWIIDSNGRFLMHWEETGGPAPAAAEISGVGMSIVKRNIPHALGGEADVRFDRNGLKARFAIPQRYVSTPRSIAKPAHSVHRASPNRPLDGFSLLVVDDQILTAMELEEALFERGASAIDLAGTEVKALELLERAVPDAAILDVDLGDETSIALAGELSRRSIPFVFAATDADRALIPAKFHDIAIASKPYSPDQVADLLKEALMPHLIRAVLTKWV